MLPLRHIAARRAAPGLLLAALLVLLAAACQPALEVAPTLIALPSLTPSDTPSPVPPTLAPSDTPRPSPTPACGLRLRALQEAVAAACAELANGDLCYGALVSVAPPAVTPFAAPGDALPLALLDRVDTAAYDPAAGLWGLAVLRAFADPPGIAPGQWVSLVPFGLTALLDTNQGARPFQNVKLVTAAEADPCADAPLPGLLLQNITLDAAEVVINGLTLHLQGRTTLLVRAQQGTAMTAAALAGQARAATGDGSLDVPTGGQVRVTLGGADGLTAEGALALEPRDSSDTNLLPLAALPQTVAVGPPLRVTPAGAANEAAVLATLNAARATATPTPTETPFVPFPGTPPGGIYLSFEGKRILPNDEILTGAVRPGAGQSDAWVFRPVGLAPGSQDYFAIEALSDWDPVITIESATWGVYVENRNNAVGRYEAYSQALAGSGGDWRILISDTEGRGGSYTIRYRCAGQCATATPAP